MKNFSQEICLQIHQGKVTYGRFGTSRDIIFITTRNHLPYDKVDDDPSQEEGPKETPLVITIVMIVVVVVGVLYSMIYFICVSASFAHQPCIGCQASLLLQIHIN